MNLNLHKMFLQKHLKIEKPSAITKNITEIKHKPNAIGIPEKSITTVETPTINPNNNGSTI